LDPGIRLPVLLQGADHIVCDLLKTLRVTGTANEIQILLGKALDSLSQHVKVAKHWGDSAVGCGIRILTTTRAVYKTLNFPAQNTLLQVVGIKCTSVNCELPKEPEP
jgi:hypothetical protein